METGERLAAYLAGELDTDQRTALEAALARDASLRAQLARLRRLEDLLGDLPAVEPPMGFTAGLRGLLSDELAALPADPEAAATLRAAVGRAGDAAPSDTVVPASELTRRRERRSRMGARAWRVSAGLATAAAVAVGVVVLTSPGADDRALPTAGRGTEADMAADGDMADGAGSAAMDSAEMAPAPVSGPVLAEGGRYDAGSLSRLADDPRILDALAGAARDPAGFEAVTRSQGLPIGPTATTGGATTGGADGADDAGDADATGPLDEPIAALPEQLDVLALAGRCLPTIYDDTQSLVPLFLDAGTFDDAPVLLAVFGSTGPGGELSRLQVWVLDASDCFPLHYAQFDQ